MTICGIFFFLFFFCALCFRKYVTMKIILTLKAVELLRPRLPAGDRFLATTFKLSIFHFSAPTRRLTALPSTYTHTHTHERLEWLQEVRCSLLALAEGRLSEAHQHSKLSRFHCCNRCRLSASLKHQLPLPPSCIGSTFVAIAVVFTIVAAAVVVQSSSSTLLISESFSESSAATAEPLRHSSSLNDDADIPLTNRRAD